jgi:acyl carrier protein
MTEKMLTCCPKTYPIHGRVAVNPNEKIKAFIAKDLLGDASYQIDDDQSLIGGGLIDSFALVEIGLFIEKAWGIRVPDRDLTVAKMDTVEQMVAYIQRRTNKA